MNQEPIIIKHSGEQVPFSAEKFRMSLHRSGASEKIIETVVEKIRRQLRSGMTTAELHRRTRHLLQKLSRNELAGRYDLKQALARLGPTGFPFERYVAHIFQAYGYKTQVDVEVIGHCAPHEVDVVGTNDKERIIIECKFHQSGGRCAVQTTLYVKARFDDIQQACQEKSSCGPKYNKCWLVTNTKFTTIALQYGRCIGLNLLAWSYPENQGIEKLIDRYSLYPITCLPSLSPAAIQQLTRAGIVLCKELIDQKIMLRRLDFSDEKIDMIIRECGMICQKRYMPDK